MKNISLKWKLFLVFSYIEFAFWTILFCTFIIRTTPNNIRFTLLAIFGLGSLMGNSFLSIYIVTRYFPASLVPSNTITLMKVTRVFSIISWLFFLIMSIVVVQSIFSEESVYEDTQSRVFFISILVICILHLYTFIMQFGIFSLLRHNHAMTVNLLIDSIGEEENIPS